MTTTTTTPNLWLWLGPYALLMLFMVHAMVQLTVSLLAQRPSHRRKPLTADALRAKLAALASIDTSYTLREGEDCDIEFIRTDTANATEPRLRARWSTTVTLRLLLDDARHDVRIGEASRSAGYTIGLAGWLPRLWAYAGYHAGPPGRSPLTDAISKAVLAGGWSYRPVIFPYQATYRGAAFMQWLTPAPLRQTRAVTLWGILYPLSYWLGMGWLIALGGSEMYTAHNLIILALISAVWWGIWAFLAWALCGFPRFWLRRDG